jgi:hypothetical protein
MVFRGSERNSIENPWDFIENPWDSIENLWDSMVTLDIKSGETMEHQWGNMEFSGHHGKSGVRWFLNHLGLTLTKQGVCGCDREPNYGGRGRFHCIDHLTDPGTVLAVVSSHGTHCTAIDCPPDRVVRRTDCPTVPLIQGADCQRHAAVSVTDSTSADPPIDPGAQYQLVIAPPSSARSWQPH